MDREQLRSKAIAALNKAIGLRWLISTEDRAWLEAARRTLHKDVCNPVLDDVIAEKNKERT